MDYAALGAVLDAFSATVTSDFSAEDILSQLARAATRVLDVDGAGIMSSSGGQLLRLVFATDAPIDEVEHLQERLQSGPCQTCLRSSTVVNIADLAYEGDWPEYQARAVELGLHSVAALPLRGRGRIWGVLDLYRRAAVRLDDEELAAATTLANLATSYLVVAADRDTARRTQDELAHRAMFDELTGLPVRWVFLEQLEHALARLRRHSGHVGVLFVDLDGLKHVNDTGGHLAGDALINTCAARITTALRPTDVVARVGGDEFVVLLEDINGAQDGALVAQRILAELAAPYSLDGHVLQPSASIGVAVTDDPATPADTLISHADAAMYRAKHDEPGRYKVFDPAAYASARAVSSARERLTVALREAVRGGQLELHYQPIVDLTDVRGGEAYAVEALVRWRHPQRGLLSAGEFIETAERSGLVGELGAWVLAAACRQLAAWDEQLGGHAPGRLFVNTSILELDRPTLARSVASVLAANALSPERLTLEITETALFTRSQAVLGAVRELRELGCELAIDDFGTGYSSLSRLVQIPASVLKVDQSFARSLRTSPEATAVVSAVLLLGRSLHRTVVVEGVEDGVTLRLLRELGATHVQGFHLGVPKPADRLTVDLEERAQLQH